VLGSDSEAEPLDGIVFDSATEDDES